MRVAYQAGVLKALNELGYSFAHGDGASGGTMNLAMLISGLSPDEMCDRWRSLDVHQFASLMPITDYLESWNMTGVSSSEGIRKRVFPHLGIDIEAIRRSRSMAATFNVCNFSRKVSEVIPAEALTLDLLVAGISLPIFMPAVLIDKDWYTDAVWIKDANLMSAVAQGSEELWIVWCIGNTSAYLSGALNQYVHMIEMAANGHLFEEFNQIGELNRQFLSASGTQRPIRIHVIKPAFPLPLDPDFFLGRITASTLIEMGYSDTYRYVEHEMAVEGLPLDPSTTQMRLPGPGVTFRKTMTGRCPLTDGDRAPSKKHDSTESAELTLRTETRIHDLKAFAAGDLTVLQMTGNISHPLLGNTIPLIDASFAHSEQNESSTGYSLSGRFRTADHHYVFQAKPRGPAIKTPMGFLFARSLDLVLSRRSDGASEPIGTAIIKCRPADGWQMFRTVRLTHAPTFREKLQALSSLWAAVRRP
jgi:predicted acylesterase/phospholipase RssA